MTLDFINPPLLIAWSVFFSLGLFQSVFWLWFADRVRGKPLEDSSPCKAVAVPALQDDVYPELPRSSNKKLKILWISISMNRNNLFPLLIYYSYFLIIFFVIY